MKKYLIVMTNTHGIYYVTFNNGQYKGTTKQSKANKFTKEFAQSIMTKLNFNGKIELAIA